MKRHFVNFRPVAKPHGKRVLCVSRGQLFYIDFEEPVYFKVALGHYVFKLGRDFTLSLYEYGIRLRSVGYVDIYMPSQVFCLVDRIGNPSRISSDAVSDVFQLHRRLSKV